MKTTYKILFIIHIIGIIVSVLCLGIYLLSHYNRMIEIYRAFSVVSLYFNFLFGLVCVIPVILKLTVFRNLEISNKYQLSYMYYMVITLMILMLLPLLETYIFIAI